MAIDRRCDAAGDRNTGECAARIDLRPARIVAEEIDTLGDRKRFVVGSMENIDGVAIVGHPQGGRHGAERVDIVGFRHAARVARTRVCHGVAVSQWAGRISHVNPVVVNPISRGQ